MVNIPLAERFKEIANLVSSQSFFITLFVILILTIAVLIINVKVKSKAPRYIAAIVYVGIAILALGRYGHYVLTFNDSIVEKFFKAFYFPNLVVYLSMLLISLLLMLANIIDKRFSLFARIINSAAFFLIWFLFVLLIDTVKKAGLNFYDVKDLYSNQTVMILLQTSMSIFAVWISVVIIDLIVRKVADKMDKKDNSISKNIEEEPIATPISINNETNDVIATKIEEPISMNTDNTMDIPNYSFNNNDHNSFNNYNNYNYNNYNTFDPYTMVQNDVVNSVPQEDNNNNNNNEEEIL